MELWQVAHENRLLKVGDMAPEFVLLDSLTGKNVALTDLLERPLLLYFARGTWCPTCRKWMSIIEQHMPQLEERGAGTATIMAQRLERMHTDLAGAGYPFPVLSDADRTVVKEWGVYVRANFESINIARPANFVLDTSGTIRFMHIASVQFEYASFDDILGTLEAIS
jgi:peroxiredoxin